MWSEKEQDVSCLMPELTHEVEAGEGQRPLLSIEGLYLKREESEILRGVDLSVGRTARGDRDSEG